MIITLKLIWFNSTIEELGEHVSYIYTCISGSVMHFMSGFMYAGVHGKAYPIFSSFRKKLLN